MAKLITKLKHEFLAMLPPTIFFYIALHIVSVVHSLMLEGTGISVLSSASVTIAALVLGKAVLIADMLPIINRYPDRPLIYNVTWKTLIYLMDIPARSLSGTSGRILATDWRAGRR